MTLVADSKHTRSKLFYCKGLLTVEVSSQGHRRALQAAGQCLAQESENTAGLPSTLVACDQMRSVLSLYEVGRPSPQVYSPYGQLTRGSDVLSLLAFNGERPEAVTGNYLLGNGYRQFSPVIKRFCSPDSWSPFGAGGLNAYAYCAGDPINRTDPTGHIWGIGKFFRRLFGLKSKQPKGAEPTVSAQRVAARTDAPAGTLASSATVKEPAVLPFGREYTDAEIAQQFQLFENYESARNTVSSNTNRYFQSHGSSPDVAAGKQYENFLSQETLLTSKHAEQLSLGDLTNELDQVNNRMKGAGSSRDVMVREVLIAELRRRVS